MAKVRITESELRGIIKESIENILKEDYASRMARRNTKYNDAFANAQKYAKDWDELTPEEQAQYGSLQNNAGYAGGAKANYLRQKQSAENKLQRKTRRNGYQFQQQLQAANQKVTELTQQVAALTQEKEQLTQQAAALTQENTGLKRKVNYYWGLAKKAQQPAQPAAGQQPAAPQTPATPPQQTYQA